MRPVPCSFPLTTDVAPCQHLCSHIYSNQVQCRVMCRFPIDLVKTWLVEEEDDSVVRRPCFSVSQQTMAVVLLRILGSLK